jgi:hypothetical protein
MRFFDEGFRERFILLYERGNEVLECSCVLDFVAAAEEG